MRSAMAASVVEGSAARAGFGKVTPAIARGRAARTALRRGTDSNSFWSRGFTRRRMKEVAGHSAPRSGFRRLRPSFGEARLPGTDRVDDIDDRLGHQSGLLLVDLMAAVRIRDVPGARNERSQAILRLFLRGVRDVAEIGRNIRRQRPIGNQRRDLRAPGPVCGENNEGKRAQGRRGPDLVEAAVRVDPFQRRIEGQAFRYVAFYQHALCRPLLRRFRLLKPFGESVDEHKTGSIVRISLRVE